MELLRSRSPVHLLVLLLVSIAPPLSAESIGAKVLASTDPALQVVPPSSIHPSCRHLGTAQEIVDGVTVGEFACAAGTRGLICVRSAEGNATTPIVARKIAQGAVLTRAELFSIDAMMYAGLDALIVASSSGVMELQRALRAPDLEAMLRLMRVSRNRSYAMTARESSSKPYFPEGASVVVEIAHPFQVGRDLYYASDVTVNAGTSISTPSAPAFDYMAIRSNRWNGLAIAIGTGIGPFVCSAQGWKEMADQARLETLDKPKIVVTETRIRRRNQL